jgi:hypothetical protein
MLVRFPSLDAAKDSVGLSKQRGKRNFTFGLTKFGVMDGAGKLDAISYVCSQSALSRIYFTK